MKNLCRRVVAGALAGCVLGLSPGGECYRAAAQRTGPGRVPSVPIRVEVANAPAGAFSLPDAVMGVARREPYLNAAIFSRSSELAIPGATRDAAPLASRGVFSTPHSPGFRAQAARTDSTASAKLKKPSFIEGELPKNMPIAPRAPAFHGAGGLVLGLESWLSRFSRSRDLSARWGLFSSLYAGGRSRAFSSLPGVPLEGGGGARLFHAEKSSVERLSENGVPSPGPPRVGGKNTELFSLALRTAGTVVLAVAALTLFHVPFIGATNWVWIGLGFLGAAKFLAKPQSQETGGSRVLPREWSARLRNMFLIGGAFKILDAADKALDAHMPFQARVGAGRPSAAALWLASGLRAALRVLPLALLGVLAGSLASFADVMSRGASAGQGDTARILIHVPWLRILSVYLAYTALQQLLFIGAVFSGIWASLRRVRFIKSSAFLAAVLSLILGGILLWTQHEPLSLILPFLGIEAAFLYAYARTKSLLVPLAANAISGVVSLYSARMIALLQAKNLGTLAELAGIPGFWGVVLAAAVATAMFAALALWQYRGGGSFMKQAVLREVARLKEVGARWKAGRPDGAPPSPFPALLASAPWGLVMYLASYAVYWATFALFPAHEVLPEVLIRALKMPFDQLVYVFILGAALEEYVFRRGLFRKILSKTSSPWGFWIAALASSIVFSAIHFIDLASIFSAFGPLSEFVRMLLGVYSFSWAGFVGRVAAGMVLAFLYHRSGVLIVPIAAHFASNLLEAVGLRWGLNWFLVAIGILFALQIFARPPAGEGTGVLSGTLSADDGSRGTGSADSERAQ